MDAMILILFAMAALLAGGALLWGFVQPEPQRVPVRRLPAPGPRER